MGLEIALWQPQIPSNTGNIARTCVVTSCPLHLIEPLGFSIEEKAVKRAGLDYWFDLDLTLWPNLDSFLSHMSGKPVYAFTTKAKQTYSNVQFAEDSIFLFGSETQGLPNSYLKTHDQNLLRIPMLEGHRSLNLANSVAIVAYEYLRQFNYPDLL